MKNWKWGKLKEFLERDMKDSEKEAKQAELEGDEPARDKWKSCALTAEYFLAYMEHLEKE